MLALRCVRTKERDPNCLASERSSHVLSCLTSFASVVVAALLLDLSLLRLRGCMCVYMSMCLRRLVTAGTCTIRACLMRKCLATYKNAAASLSRRSPCDSGSPSDGCEIIPVMALNVPGVSGVLAALRGWQGLISWSGLRTRLLLPHDAFLLCFIGVPNCQGSAGAGVVVLMRCDVLCMSLGPSAFSVSSQALPRGPERAAPKAPAGAISVSKTPSLIGPMKTAPSCAAAGFWRFLGIEESNEET